MTYLGSAHESSLKHLQNPNERDQYAQKKGVEAAMMMYPIVGTNTSNLEYSER